MPFDMVSVLVFPETDLIFIYSAKINWFRKLGFSVPLGTIFIYMTSTAIDY